MAQVSEDTPETYQEWLQAALSRDADVWAALERALARVRARRERQSRAGR